MKHEPDTDTAPTAPDTKKAGDPTGAGAALCGLPSAELVALARRGDRGAFEELYQRSYPLVARRVSHLVGPGGPAADLVQETFTQAFSKLHRFREAAPFIHWVLRIATNHCRSHFRRQRRSVWRLWEQPEREREVADRGDLDRSYPQLEAVHRALARLSSRQREAVILFELEGLTLAELAATLEVPLHTAASRVRRGRRRLRRLLQQMGFAPTVLDTAAIGLAPCGGEPR